MIWYFETGTAIRASLSYTAAFTSLYNNLLPDSVVSIGQFKDHGTPQPLCHCKNQRIYFPTIASLTYGYDTTLTVVQQLVQKNVVQGV